MIFTGVSLADPVAGKWEVTRFLHTSGDAQPVAGISMLSGNMGLPPVWLVYGLTISIRHPPLRGLGRKPSVREGYGRGLLLRDEDPAGAVCALYSHQRDWPTGSKSTCRHGWPLICPIWARSLWRPCVITLREGAVLAPEE